MQGLLNRLSQVSAFFGKTFAIWVILFAVLSYYFPDAFKFLAAYISIMLGIVMFGMGLTLKARDFSEVFTRPFEVLAGIIGQFLIMPSLAYFLATALNLPSEIAVGIILVGCCPGGTSSNVMSYLGKGDVALSVTITACTTVLAPFVTPALIYLLASQWVDISMSAMFFSIVNIVILPIVAGVVINRVFRTAVSRVVVCLPLVSVVAIVAIVCAVVSVSQAKLQETLAQTGALVFVVVILHNCLGYLLGYIMAKALRMKLPQRKTLSIEVGMQNSGLGVALAMAHFNPLSAVPAAIFSVWHNISGPIVATIFVNMTEKAKDQEKATENVAVKQ